jgi:hypothetical protein
MREVGEEDRRRKVAGTRRNGGSVPNGADGESWNGGEARRCIDGESMRAKLRQAAVATAARVGGGRRRFLTGVRRNRRESKYTENKKNFGNSEMCC